MCKVGSQLQKVREGNIEKGVSQESGINFDLDVILL